MNQFHGFLGLSYIFSRFRRISILYSWKYESGNFWNTSSSLSMGTRMDTIFPVTKRKRGLRLKTSPQISGVDLLTWLISISLENKTLETPLRYIYTYIFVLQSAPIWIRGHSKNLSMHFCLFDSGIRHKFSFKK